MSKFTVYGSEVVYYKFEVEAENREQALEKALDIVPSQENIEDYDNFTIENIEEN